MRTYRQIDRYADDDRMRTIQKRVAPASFVVACLSVCLCSQLYVSMYGRAYKVFGDMYTIGSCYGLFGPLSTYASFWKITVLNLVKNKPITSIIGSRIEYIFSHIFGGYLFLKGLTP